MEIWVLLSIANEYDQPDNNLEAWWVNKPSFAQIASVINITFNKEKGSVDIAKILKGEEVRINDCDYRLREIEEGKVKDENH